jgi:hypothetical protein
MREDLMKIGTIMCTVTGGFILGFCACMMDNVSEACENSHSNHHKCVNETRWNETTTILKSEIKE